MRQHPDATPARDAEIAAFLAKYDRIAGGRLRQSSENFEQGGFSGAVAAR